MIYLLLAVTTYIVINLGSEQLPKILQMVSTVAFYYSLYFLGFTILSIGFLLFKVIQATRSVTLNHPKELGVEDFWISFIKGNLTYSHSFFFIKRQIVPYRLDKIYRNVFEGNISLEKKYVEKFLLNQDYSSPEFKELYGKLKDYFTPDKGMAYGNDSLVELLVSNYIINHKARILAIKKNEEFNSFLNKHK